MKNRLFIRTLEIRGKLLKENPYLKTNGAGLGFDLGENNAIEQPPSRNDITLYKPILGTVGCWGYYWDEQWFEKDPVTELDYDYNDTVKAKRNFKEMNTNIDDKTFWDINTRYQNFLVNLSLKVTMHQIKI